MWAFYIGEIRMDKCDMSSDQENVEFYFLKNSRFKVEGNILTKKKSWRKYEKNEIEGKKV